MNYKLFIYSTLTLNNYFSQITKCSFCRIIVIFVFCVHNSVMIYAYIDTTYIFLVVTICFFQNTLPTFAFD